MSVWMSHRKNYNLLRVQQLNTEYYFGTVSRSVQNLYYLLLLVDDQQKYHTASFLIKQIYCLLEYW